jgi:hypothetical protein
MALSDEASAKAECERQSSQLKNNRNGTFIKKRSFYRLETGEEIK